MPSGYVEREMAIVRMTRVLTENPKTLNDADAAIFAWTHAGFSDAQIAACGDECRRRAFLIRERMKLARAL